MLGGPVARELSNAGFAVRVIARDVVDAKKCFPDLEVVAGDLRDVSSLRKALTGQDAVYLNLSVKQTESRRDFHAETDGLVNLLDAAQHSGLQRIAYLSSLVMRYQGMNGFSWWVFGVKHKAVQLLRESDIPHSLFYPSCFMDSMLHTQRLGNRILLVGKSPVTPYYIAASDYGRQVARAFQRAMAGENQEYIIQGPEPLTQDEAARQLITCYTGAQLRTLTAPPLLLKAGSFFSAQADYGWHITEALNTYPERFEAEQTWAELGKPATTVRQFAEQAAS